MRLIHSLRFRERRQDLGNGLRGCRIFDLNQQLISMAHTKRHDADDAARIRCPAVRSKRDQGGHTFGAPRQQGRGPGV